MLRIRSRQVTSKQALVSDHSNHSWYSHEKPTKQSSFFLISPRIFKGFFKIDPMLSSTSILDKNPFSIVANFLVFDNNHNNNNKSTKTLQKHAWEQSNNKQGLGLALIVENLETNNNNNTTTKLHKRKLVVFGSQLRIQVPISSVFPCFSPESPREFGIKTPRNNLWPFGSNNSNAQVHPEELFTKNESLSMNDIDEQSEDYTCVISHGPNPKTTHIFGNCIVESCCGKIVGSSCFSSNSNGNCSFSLDNLTSSQENYLSYCYHCKKKLVEGKDIYMYRGEKAFCSEECRCQEMLSDEVEN